MMGKKLLVVSYSNKSYETSRLVEEAEKLGLEAEGKEYTEWIYDLSNDRVGVIDSDTGKDMSEYDYVILRGSGKGRLSFWKHKGVLVRYLESKEVRVLNLKYYKEYCGGANKALQQLVFLQSGLGVIDSKIYSSLAYVNREELCRYPFVVKTLKGSGGVEVTKVDDDGTRFNVFTNNEPQNLLVQTHVEGGVDYRVIVVGGEVLGVMGRKAKEGVFVTNVSAGGSTFFVEVDDEFGKLAVEAARALGLEYSGVDLIRHNNELRVVEVNAAAEFCGFEDCSGINVAQKIIEYLLV